MDEVEQLNRMELPVLVGTTSVDVFETLSGRLTRRVIRHQVLNVRHHRAGSESVRDAGAPGAVTIVIVDLMADLRKTVASYFYRAQVGPPPRRRLP
jgi:preprotein translocase subunit SecA